MRKSSAGRGERVFEIDAGKLAEAAHFASRALSSPGRSPQARCPEGRPQQKHQRNLWPLIGWLLRKHLLEYADNDHKNATADGATGDLRNDRADVEIAGTRSAEDGLKNLASDTTPGSSRPGSWWFLFR